MLTILVLALSFVGVMSGMGFIFAGITGEKQQRVTEQLVRAQIGGGARAADAVVPEVAGGLFGTEDLQNAVQSFLTDGPGKATYEGR